MHKVGEMFDSDVSIVHKNTEQTTRVQAHLLKISKREIRSCPNATDPTLRQLQTEVAAAEEN